MSYKSPSSVVQLWTTYAYNLFYLHSKKGEKHHMEKYILTGGPGSGKSSILFELEGRGEYIVREAAEDYIRKQQSKGIKEPWFESDFQDEILRLQLMRENKVSSDAKRVYLDRSCLDGMAYLEKGSSTYSKIHHIMTTEVAYNKKVFLVELLDTVETNEVRRENYAGAKELQDKLELLYIEYGYDIIRVPSGDVRERADLVMMHTTGK